MTSRSHAPSDESAARALIDKVKEKRGYLLPHHGLLAVASPALLEGYDAAYTAMTLQQRHMGERDKEFVWLVVLTSTEEAIATHHIAKFKEAGGTNKEVELAFQLAGYARSATCFAFVEERWSSHLPDYQRERVYRAGLQKLVAGESLSPSLVEMSMAAAHVCRRGWEELAWHIRAAYREDTNEYELAEAISYAMFPGSIPNFVNACRVWLDLIRGGEVSASGPFRVWAEATGQGGFDEAAGVAT